MLYKNKLGFFELDGKTVQKQVFNNLIMSHGILIKCNIRYCLFNKVNLYDSNLTETFFDNCVFFGCDLSDSIVFHTNFTNSTFIDTKLIKIDSIETRIMRSNFVNCDFKLFDFGSSFIEGVHVVDPINQVSISSVIAVKRIY